MHRGMLVFDGNWRDDLGAADVQCRQVGAGGQYKGVSFRWCGGGEWVGGGTCNDARVRVEGVRHEGLGKVVCGTGSERSLGWCLVMVPSE